MNATGKNHLDYLDALRGCAVLAVYLQHSLGYVYHTYPAHPWHGYLKFLIAESIDWGQFGVILFFLISGFIIPSSLKAGTSLSKFFISRAFRLYPAYWIALALIVISAGYMQHSPPSYSYTQILANLTMVPKIFGSNEMSGVFWTLFIEILFYASCAILFKLKWLDQPIAIAIIAIGLNLTTPLAILLNKIYQLGIPVQFVLFHLSFLFAGNLLRLAIVEKGKAAIWSVATFLPLCLLNIAIATGLLFPVPEAAARGFVMFRAESNVHAYVLAVGFFIYTIYLKSLNNRFLIELGKISYSVYLLHMLCLALVMELFPPQTVAGSATYFIAGAVMSFLAAKLSFKYIEQPAIEFGRKIIKSRGYA